MGILAILAQMLRDQAELASIVADTQILDANRRNRLAARIQKNRDNFDRFVWNYKLPVERRMNVPAVACPECHGLALAKWAQNLGL